MELRKEKSHLTGGLQVSKKKTISKKQQYHAFIVDGGENITKVYSPLLLQKAQQTKDILLNPNAYRVEQVNGKRVHKHNLDLSTLHLSFAVSTWNMRGIMAKINSVVSSGLSISAVGKNKISPDEEKTLLENLNDLCPKYDNDIIEYVKAYMLEAEIFGYSLPVQYPYELDILPSNYCYKKLTEAKWLYDIGKGQSQLFCQYGTTPSKGEEKGLVIPIVKRSTVDRVYGSPDFLQAMPAIALNTLIDEYNLNFFANNAIPSYAVIISGEAPAEFEDVIKEHFRTHIRGQSHKTLTLSLPDGATMKFEKLSTEIKEASFKLLRKDTRDEILQAHAVPPVIAGIIETGSLGGNVGQEQITAYKNQVVDPLQRKYIRPLQLILNKIVGDSKYQITFKTYDIEDDKLNAEIDKIDIESGKITINEARARRGLDALSNSLADIPSSFWGNDKNVGSFKSLDEATEAIKKINALIRKYEVA